MANGTIGIHPDHPFAGGFGVGGGVVVVVVIVVSGERRTLTHTRGGRRWE